MNNSLKQTLVTSRYCFGSPWEEKHRRWPWKRVFELFGNDFGSKIRDFLLSCTCSISVPICEVEYFKSFSISLYCLRTSTSSDTSWRWPGRRHSKRRLNVVIRWRRWWQHHSERCVTFLCFCWAAFYNFDPLPHSGNQMRSCAIATKMVSTVSSLNFVCKSTLWFCNTTPIFLKIRISWRPTCLTLDALRETEEE